MKARSWRWCLHCERCYRSGSFRLIDGLKMCPYPDCDGDTFLDGSSWEEIRWWAWGRDFPVVPELGVRYPMYGGVTKCHGRGKVPRGTRK